MFRSFYRGQNFVFLLFDIFILGCELGIIKQKTVCMCVCVCVCVLLTALQLHLTQLRVHWEECKIQGTRQRHRKSTHRSTNTFKVFSASASNQKAGSWGQLGINGANRASLQPFIL